MLKDLQHGMMELVSARAGVAAALEGASPQARELADAVAGDARLDALGRLQVYADMYRLRLRAALESIFPALARALGEEELGEVCAAYLEAHPSRHPSLRWIGRELPAFLEGWRRDLAALEWARHDVFDAADEEPLSMEAVAALGPEGIGELRLRLVAAHRLVPVAHEVERVWKGEDEVAELPGVLLVWRDGVSVYHRRVREPAELDALRAAAAGESLTFASLCEGVMAAAGPLEEAPRRAGELLGRWLGDKLLAR